MKVILLTKKTEHCKKIQNRVRNGFENAVIIEGDVGDSLPEIDVDGYMIISFLSPWIVPESWLEKAQTAINFHPAPPAYPGTGCYNFALYNEEKEYGVTCHHMLTKVDTGKIISVIKFSTDGCDSILTLKNKTMQYLINQFYEVWDFIISEKELPKSDEVWLRKPYTRKDLKELCRITLNMDEEEIKKRIKATTFPGARDGPYLDLNGDKFSLVHKE